MKGKYKPKNPAKYKGDPRTIVYRSSWELKFMGYVDGHNEIIEWSSEEFSIPYRSPIDGKVHRYFPDFFIKKKTAQGTTESFVVEIKPYKETIAPKVQSKPTKQYLREVYTWGINQAKWQAAEEYCKDRMWKFVKITEYELGIKL